jgi:hypothetical protein
MLSGFNSSAIRRFAGGEKLLTLQPIAVPSSSVSISAGIMDVLDPEDEDILRGAENSSPADAESRTF